MRSIAKKSCFFESLPMRLIVHHTSYITGCVTPPASKSQTIRGLILSLLASGESTLRNVLQSEDSEDAKRICEDLGCTLQKKADQLIVHSPGLPIAPRSARLYSGNSGITTRFIMPILGLRKYCDEPITLDCGAQMRLRPIHSLVTALRALGMNIRYDSCEGMLPVTISGRLLGGKTAVNGITSQYLSALLLALPCAEQDSIITVEDLHERPYVALTLNWLKQQHIVYEHKKNRQQDSYFIPGRQAYKPFTTTIAGDFSSASYLLAAAALIPGCVTLTGLDMADPQGDKALVTILQKMGAEITIEDKKIIIIGGKPLTGFAIDANDIPDLLPVLAVLGTQAQGRTEIRNVAQARIKETDRIHSMTQGLSILGAKIIEHADGLTVYQSQLTGGFVKGYGDHRTVMALSIAGLCAAQAVHIDEAQAIDKTFPHYVTLMQSLGAKMELLP
jgi:3-phosphoshikimate 1-carboxyvinyltransferase